MHVILLRHATRSPIGPGDGGLNETGRRQAAELIDRLSPLGPIPRPTVLIASPKRRAQETLTPLSGYSGIKINVDKKVDERGDSEPVTEFLARVRTWVRDVSGEFGANDVILVCSHLDWLEEAMRALPSDLTDLELERPFVPCEARVFEIRDGIWYSQNK